VRQVNAGYCRVKPTNPFLLHGVFTHNLKEFRFVCGDVVKTVERKNTSSTEISPWICLLKANVFPVGIDQSLVAFLTSRIILLENTVVQRFQKGLMLLILLIIQMDKQVFESVVVSHLIMG
jgi:hypothetical protein